MSGKNKEELTAEALGLGIDLSDDPTKAVIQQRIDDKMEEMAANLMNPDTLLGEHTAPRGRFRGGRGDQNVNGPRRAPEPVEQLEPVEEDDEGEEPEDDSVVVFTTEELLALGATADAEDNDVDERAAAQETLEELAEERELNHEDYESWTLLAQALVTSEPVD